MLCTNHPHRTVRRGETVGRRGTVQRTRGRGSSARTRGTISYASLFWYGISFFSPLRAREDHGGFVTCSPPLWRTFVYLYLRTHGFAFFY